MPTVYSKTDVPPRESMEYWTEVVAKGKHTMPVLAIGADKSFGTAMADDLRFVAENVSAAVIANSGPPCALSLIGSLRWRAPSLRQGDEFARVARHGGKATSFPIGLGGVDAVLGRGDEIPPDMPRPIHRLAAEQHEARLRGC